MQAAEATATLPSYQPEAATTVGLGLHFKYDFSQRSTLLSGHEHTRLSDPLANNPIVVTRSVNMLYLGYGWRL